MKFCRCHSCVRFTFWAHSSDGKNVKEREREKKYMKQNKNKNFSYENDEFNSYFGWNRLEREKINYWIDKDDTTPIRAQPQQHSTIAWTKIITFCRLYCTTAKEWEMTFWWNWIHIIARNRFGKNVIKSCEFKIFKCVAPSLPHSDKCSIWRFSFEIYVYQSYALRETDWNQGIS